MRLITSILVSFGCLFSSHAFGMNWNSNDYPTSVALDDTTQLGALCLPTGDTMITIIPVIAPPGGIWDATCGACINSQGVFDPSGLPAGEYLFWYEQGSLGDTFRIVINPQPELMLDGKDTLDYREETMLTATGAQSYVWVTLDSLSCKDCADPIFTPDTTTIFTVIGTDVNGCMDTGTLRIVVRPEFKVRMPNAFTPNGDQSNDTYRPAFRGDIFKDYHLVIYSRWGERVFETYTIGEGWDGKIGDQTGSSDVYVCIFEYEFTNGFAEKLMNEVTLLR